MDTIQIKCISLDEFKEIINESIEKVISKIPLSNSKSQIELYATRKEVAKALHISLPTLHQYVKAGVLKAYRLKGRILFKWEEIESSLSKIESLKYRRAQ